MEMITLAGTAIALESSGKGVLQEIDISENRIVAAVSAIQVRQGVDIHIHHNRIRILDKEGSGIAIRMLADDSVIERNDIGVVPADRTPPPDVPEDTPDPTTLVQIRYFSTPFAFFVCLRTTFLEYSSLPSR